MSDGGKTSPSDFVSGLFDITGRVAVVTGAGSGLGAAIAIGYAQAGAKVVLADINTAGAEATAKTISDNGGVATVCEVDVTKRASIDRAAERSVSEFGRVDILVNSAGTAFRSPVEDFPEDKFDLIIALNLKGTYMACQSFGRLMLDQGKGSIVNISSIGGVIAYPLSSAYLASKGGVVQITKSFALEWRNRGVRVNAIGPTLMESPLTVKAAQTTSLTADFITDRMIRRRLGLPHELVGAAIFLASDASELVTGHTLMCDDGYTIV